VRSLADRILVIYEGKIVGEFPPDASEEELGIAMTGGGAGRAAA
jgi:simple sugar transport system ATP-binding protein